MTSLAQMRLPAQAAGTRTFASNQNSFMNGTNANYIDYMYAQWQKDPSSVHASWNAYFSAEEGGASVSFQAPPTLGQTPVDNQLSQLLQQLQGASLGGTVSGADSVRVADESIRLTMLLRAFMTHGHLVADIDPLKLREVYKDSPSLAKKFRFPDEGMVSILDPAAYGFTEQDMDKEIHYSNPYKGTILKQKSKWKLRDLIEAYRNAYCGKIGVEFMHIEDREVCNWMRERFEEIQYHTPEKDKKMHMYERLNCAHQWGNFMS